MSKLTAEAKRVVNEQRLAFVATTCPNGTPNVSPKGTIAVWDDEHLVFADIRSPVTMSNLEQNPSVEINVVDPFSRKGFRFKGVAQIVRSGDLFDRLKTFYDGNRVDTSGRRGFEYRAFVLIKVDRVAPLTSPAYDDGTGESEIRARWTAYYEALHRRQNE